MRYLISEKGFIPFLTNHYNPENFNIGTWMIVYDLHQMKYTEDGVEWNNIEEDSL